MEAGPLRLRSGAEIAASNISVARVSYVNVTRPTDAFGKAGEWPDPLPPYEGPFEAPAGENCPLWITVFVPEGTPAGDYEGQVALSSDQWSVAVPVRLHVWNFTPRTPSIRSSFGLVAADIKAYHNLTTREELEKVYDLYMENFRAHRWPRPPSVTFILSRSTFWASTGREASSCPTRRRRPAVPEDRRLEPERGGRGDKRARPIPVAAGPLPPGLVGQDGKSGTGLYGLPGGPRRSRRARPSSQPGQGLQGSRRMAGRAARGAGLPGRGQVRRPPPLPGLPRRDAGSMGRLISMTFP